MARESIREALRLVAAQHGAFAASQAVALGVPPTTLRSGALRGLYEEAHDGVFFVAGSSGSWRRSVVAAVLSEGDVAAASHQTAAFLHGFVGRRGDDIHVVARRWLRRRRAGINVHESTDLIPGDIESIDGIPTTNATRTVVDLGATAPWLVPGALGNAIRAGSTGLDEVERFVARVARRGRRGVGVIRPLIRDRRRWERRTESELEDRFARIVHDFDLPSPVPQFTVCDDAGRFVCRADFAYPSSRVLIELDGFAFHAGESAFQRDRTKQNRAILLGWSVFRYTWRDVVDRPEAVAAELHTVLAS